MAETHNYALRVALFQHESVLFELELDAREPRVVHIDEAIDHDDVPARRGLVLLLRIFEIAIEEEDLTRQILELARRSHSEAQALHSCLLMSL